MTNSLLLATLVIPLLRFDYPYRWLKWSVPTGQPALNPIIPIRIPNRPRLCYMIHIGCPFVHYDPWDQNLSNATRDEWKLFSCRKIKVLRGRLSNLSRHFSKRVEIINIKSYNSKSTSPMLYDTYRLFIRTLLSLRPNKRIWEKEIINLILFHLRGWINFSN